MYCIEVVYGEYSFLCLTGKYKYFSLIPEQQLHVCDEISTGTCIENVNCQLFSLYSVVILLDLMDFFSILDAGVTKRLTGAKLRGVLGVFRNCQRDLLYGIWAWES